MKVYLSITCTSKRFNNFQPDSYFLKDYELFCKTFASSGVPGYTQRNLFKILLNQIVFTIFRLIWNQTDNCLVPNWSENVYHNLILVITIFRLIWNQTDVRLVLREWPSSYYYFICIIYIQVRTLKIVTMYMRWSN